MAALTFLSVPQLHMERGAQHRLGQILRQRLGHHRVMLVTDAQLHRSGLLAPALDSLAQAGLETLVFDEVVADPPEAVVLEASARARHAEVGLVLGMGGGSSMDVAKLVALLTRSPQPLAQMYGIDQAQGERLPLVQVPTTAGTGSEVTPIAILTLGQDAKKGVVDRRLMADLAVLDASLTTGLPAAVTAATGIDAMVHAIEAFTSARLKNPLSDLLACQALQLLSTHLATACRHGDNLDAREAMLLGALLAGQAFANAPVGAVHALAYPLGARFHIPHGLSNALMLGPVLRFNAQVAPGAYAPLASVLAPESASGPDDQRCAAVLQALTRCVADTGLALRLRDHGVPQDELPRLAADAMLQTRLLINNPRPLDESQALALYRQAW
ncbi:iron-containing alcohol dehydrogenase [Aquabacterium sp. OR-4]|uniref:iron-containing alcohol dehydrogenase n=1 Tax=Aquabacterium sp. OR-4 TaxID=2978127 RepID=UPI0021B3C6F1|nr:iron-containing alcohol dehydrogenase [Aquabacterium sp. OR-4]MDT7836944.1 iron-containing alcohol dehydrogenase [Aquabacterium sp. OR-4]